MFSYAWLGSYEQHICLDAFSVFTRTATLKPSVAHGGREKGNERGCSREKVFYEADWEFIAQQIFAEHLSWPGHTRRMLLSLGKIISLSPSKLEGCQAYRDINANLIIENNYWRMRSGFSKNSFKE